MNNFTEKNQPGSIDAELHSIQEDIDEFQYITGDIDSDSETDDTEESADVFEELNQALAGTEFELLSEAVFEDEDQQEISIPNPRNVAQRLAKSKARRMIAKVARIVYRNRRYAGCAPSVARAVRAFSRKRYSTALGQAYSAYRCIQSKR